MPVKALKQKRLPNHGNLFCFAGWIRTTVCSDQCFLLKSRKELLGGAGSGLFGFLLSQIMLDRLFSIGDMTSANRKIRKNAIENISNMPKDTTNASNITGMTLSR